MATHNHSMLPPRAKPFEAADLTQSQIEQYRRDGFIQIDDVLTGDELQAARDAVAAAVEEESAGPPKADEDKGVYEKIFNQKVNLWRRHEKVAAISTSKRLGGIAARLEAMPMRLWHDQALFKEPSQGNNRTPWHQDAPYWPFSDRWRQTTIWIALQDATVQKGCMSFINGTHTLGPLPAIDLGNPQDIFQYAKHIKPVKPEPRPLKAGSCTFHNGLTFHFAGPNKTDMVREAFAIIYTPASTTYDGLKHIVTDPLGLTVGDTLPDEMFPPVSA